MTTPTLIALRMTLPPEGAVLAWERPSAAHSHE
jgi:hypothetical protein